MALTLNVRPHNPPPFTVSYPELSDAYEFGGGKSTPHTSLWILGSSTASRISSSQRKKCQMMSRPRIAIFLSRKERPWFRETPCLALRGRGTAHAASQSNGDPPQEPAVYPGGGQGNAGREDGLARAQHLRSRQSAGLHGPAGAASHSDRRIGDTAAQTLLQTVQ